MMKLSIGDLVSILGAVVILLLGYWALPLLPQNVASHWGSNGLVDGFMNKTDFVIFMSALSIFLFAIVSLLPRLDPLRKNVELFQSAFDYFKISLVIFFVYIYGLTLMYNLGYSFNLVSYLAPGFSLLLFSLGVLLSQAQKNWFIGIRTPWTLSSEKVWQQTNQLAGILFKISALLAIAGVFFPSRAFLLMVVPILAAALISIIYSYWLFTNEKKNPSKKILVKKTVIVSARKKKKKSKR